MKTKKPSHADLMVLLAKKQETTLFVDQYENPHIHFSHNGMLKTYPLKSSMVKQWLAKLLWDANGKAPGGTATNSALTILKAMAREGPQLPLYNRVAPDDREGFWIDIADTHWRAIRVTKEGWEIRSSPPIMFRRFKHQRPLPQPVPGGDFREILSFVNLKDKNHQILYIVALIAQFIPNIPHIIMIFHGPHGSGKSRAMVVTRAIVDPSSVNLLRLPRNERELVQQLYHNYLGYYDNVGTLPARASDVFCRAVTGAGNSKRELFTDDGDILYHYRRCIALNGINIAAKRGDLLDRAVLLEHSPLHGGSRIEDAELDRRLSQRAPHILGAALDILVKAMNIYPTVNLENLNRMADFTRWGYAIAEAVGYGGEAFLEAYRENIEAQSHEALKASVLAHVLLPFMEDQPAGGWSGTATELYMHLKAKADEMGISTRQKSWPKTPYWMSRRLNELSPSLPAAGYNVKTGRTGKKRRISIYRAGNTPSISVNGVMASPKAPGSDANDAKTTTLGEYSTDYNLTDDLSTVLSCLREAAKLREGRTREDDFYRIMKIKGFHRERLDRLIRTLKRDGAVYSPNPGFLGVVA